MPKLPYPYDWDELDYGDVVGDAWMEANYAPCMQPSPSKPPYSIPFLCCRPERHEGQHVALAKGAGVPAVGVGVVVYTWEDES